MADELDPQLEAALSQSYASHARKVGQPVGRLDDVMRRVVRRRNKRRTLTGVASMAIVAAGIGGMVAVGQIDSDGAARNAGAPGGPTPSVPDGGSWFVCQGPHERDGMIVYDWCELETTFGDPVWACRGEMHDPALDGDDRPRFESCDAVAEYSGPAEACLSVTAVPVDTPPPASDPGVSTTTIMTPTTYVVQCPPGAPGPTVDTAPPTTVAWPSVPCDQAPVASDAAGNCFGVPYASSPVAPTTTHSETVAVVSTAPPLPAESPRVFAIGDSVMLSAADVLQPRGWTVFAPQSLQLVDAIPIVEQLAANGTFADTEAVIVHLGTNGDFSAESLDALLAPLADVPNVLLYTVRADRSWTAGNNELLRAVDRPDDNIVLIDWEVRANECVDECFAADRIHLQENGKEFYADLARDWTGV